jgi:hypothetical protein
MKFVKIAFWGGLLLLVLPSNGEQRAAVYLNAQRTLVDIGGFCGRNPEVCDNVVSGFYGIGQKLGSTANMIETMLYDAGIGADRSQIRQPLSNLYSGNAQMTTSSLGAQDTLTSKDRFPGWRGP